MGVCELRVGFGCSLSVGVGVLGGGCWGVGGMGCGGDVWMLILLGGFLGWSFIRGVRGGGVRVEGFW